MQILVDAWPYIVFWTLYALVGGICVGIEQICSVKLGIKWEGGDLVISVLSVIFPPIGIAASIAFLLFLGMRALEDKVSRRKELRVKKQVEIEEMLTKEGFKA